MCPGNHAAAEILLLTGLLAVTAGAAGPETHGSADRVVAFDKTRVIAVYQSSVTRDGSIVTAWFKISYTTPVADQDRKLLQSEIIHARFDCEAHTWEPIEQIRLDPDGAVIASTSFAGAGAPGAGHGISESVQNYVCGSQDEAPARPEARRLM